MKTKRKPEELEMLSFVSTMPYGALVKHEWPDGDITLPDVSRYLSRLRDVLQGVSVRQQQERSRLHELESAFQGGAMLFRELLKAMPKSEPEAQS